MMFIIVLIFIAALDSSRPLMDTTAAAQQAGISGAEDMAHLRNRFVTGDWEAGKQRAAARPKKEGDEVCCVCECVSVLRDWEVGKQSAAAHPKKEGDEVCGCVKL
jgi:hypothetical protein